MHTAVPIYPGLHFGIALFTQVKLFPVQMKPEVVVLDVEVEVLEVLPPQQFRSPTIQAIVHALNIVDDDELEENTGIKL